MNNKIKLLIIFTLCLILFACRLVPIDRPVVKESPVYPQLMSNVLVASGAPTRIVVETIGLDAPVIEMDWQLQERWGELVSEWNMPDNEAGWHRNSALPGEGSNVVISGHNNSLGGRVFARLEELSAGDRVILWNDRGDSFGYEVREKKYIRTLGASEETQELLRVLIEPTPTEQLTLITCWPNWTNTHRLIIIADPERSSTVTQKYR